jgi:hypothetical protein
MASKLDNLYREGKITEMEYHTYILFGMNDIGIPYLAKTIESSFMEEPIDPRTELFSWQDGRRSVWRDIKRIINAVDRQLEVLNG